MSSNSSLIPRLARVSRACYGIVAALGAAAIWGWVLGAPALRDLGADFAPMSPSAALALLLLALVTPLARDPKIFGVSINALAAGVIGTVAFFALLGLSLRVLRFDIA